MSRTIKQKSKAVAKSCKNHGGCPYCEGNRLYKHRKKLLAYKPNTIDN
jgi:DNA-directed RNA polymerase subunit RPC12/RpoP